MTTTIAPYGEWRSPITSDLIIAKSIGLGGPQPSPHGLLWSEGRPQEGGRAVIVLRNEQGECTDLIPPPFNVRTRVHEYGGGAWLLHKDTVYFSNFSDQQIYTVSVAGGTPVALTTAPDCRFANGCVDARRNRIIYVIEDHSDAGKEAQNRLGAVDMDSGEISILASGHDFYSSPTLSGDGSCLVWITWDHPHMPWDDTTLWRANFNAAGELEEATVIAGGDGVSVQQPAFNARDALHFVSDQSGWWNLYKISEGDSATNLCPMAAEFGGPAWGFGGSHYHFFDDDVIACLYGIKNESRIGLLKDGRLEDIELPFTDIGGLRIAGSMLFFLAASPTRFNTIVSYDLASKTLNEIKCASDVSLDPRFISIPEAIEFATAENETAHAFYYPPTNGDFAAPATELPPLLVILHGGPTGATHSSISLGTQYWTSRGFALLDVNYRGSTGYGREYRDKLHLNWGITDVQDTVHGANYLVAERKADSDRLAIRGGSAGGYTTLAALTFADTFKAGASHYGIGDLEALAKDTHKFESRYLDSLIGRYPEDIETYYARSPIHHAEQLTGATIFFQGLEDQVVPPNQAQTMAKVLADKGIPVAYVPFEGEQHGFRQAHNIKRCLDLELYFYGRVFGFTPADQIDPIAITNLD